jgi:hypothetical protein
MQAGTTKQSQFCYAETCGQIRRRLHAPFENSAFPNQPLCNLEGTLKINQKVVIRHPQQFKLVAAGEVDRLLHDLLDRQGIPLAAIDPRVGAVRTVERTCKA